VVEMSKDENVNSEKEQLWAMRHTCEHVLTMAMLRIFGNKIKPAMGPATDDGFYLDFDSDIKISESDFSKIEDEMLKIIKQNLSVTKDELSVKEARDFFNKGTYKDNQYKHEWIDEIESRNEKVSVYWMGPKGKDIPDTFVDICAGPHAESTGKIVAFRLLKIAGAYWHGDEKNKMLTRIYGTAFFSRDKLKEYLTLLEEAKRRDHRKLGQKLELFLFSDLVGAGLPLYTPTGNIVRNEIIKLSRELQTEIGYEEVHTPQFNRAELFKVSGHYDKYKENMFRVKSNYTDEEFFLKPMNCPQHTQIYASKQRSYRDLPVRLADFAMLYRDEKPGELSGFSRLRGFAQDDAHNFCRPDQIKEEVSNVLKVIKKALNIYGMNYWVRLSYRDPLNKDKYLGSDEVWENAQKIIKDLAVEQKLEFQEADGEAAFYGPKIDIMVRDALNRDWQVSTVQLDFNMPMRFGLKYIDQDNTEKTPVMIHRALIGSPDRFLSIIVEHYAGKFPMWLSPRQVLIVPVADPFNDYALQVEKELKSYGIRVDCDTKASSMNKKIRDGETMYYNYILVLGEKEKQAKTLNVRIRDTKEQKEFSVKEFAEKLKLEYSTRAIKSSL